MKITCNARNNNKAIPVKDCKPNPNHPACKKCDSPNKPRPYEPTDIAAKLLPAQKPKAKIMPSSKRQVNAHKGEIAYVYLTRHPLETYKAIKFTELNSFLTGTGMDPGYKSVVMGNEESRRNFEKSKNPYYVLEAFIVAHVHKCYPPVWVMDFINERFEQYYYSDGKSLDELFGFIKKDGKGWTPPRAIMKNEERDKFIKREMFVLKELLGIPIEHAANMVASLIERKAAEWNEAGIRRLSANSIAQKYRKVWRPSLDENPYKVFRMSKYEWIDYLKEYPPDSFPDFLPYDKIEDYIEKLYS